MRNLQNMFEKLGYDQEIWENENRESLEKKMEKLMKSLSDEIYGCLLFFVMCHGTEDDLELKKNKIKRSKFIDYFHKTEQKNIAMLLFLNSCREDVKKGKVLIFGSNYKQKR